MFSANSLLLLAFSVTTLPSCTNVASPNANQTQPTGRNELFLNGVFPIGVFPNPNSPLPNGRPGASIQSWKHRRATIRSVGIERPRPQVFM